MKKVIFIIFLITLAGVIIKQDTIFPFLGSLINDSPIKENNEENNVEDPGNEQNGQTEDPEEPITEDPEDPIEEPQDPENPSVPASEIVWGDRTKKEVIFTFDGGSGNQSFDEILDALKEHGIKGTFFLTGKWAEDNPILTKQIAEEGHEIFNHTYDHPYLTQSSDQKIIQEFQKTEDIIKNLTGVSTKPYFRPPYGDRNQHVFNVASEAGYQAVYWTIDVLDWKEELGFTAQEAKDRILNNVKPGTIYLMHIGDNITGDILDDVFTQIENKGYEIVSLSESLD